MTVKELAARIGEPVLVSFEKGNISVRCRIVDARTAYGRPQLLVQPVGGLGETWIEEGRIRRDDPEVELPPAHVPKVADVTFTDTEIRVRPGICGHCCGKGFLNPDGSPNNAFDGSDSDPVIPCPQCAGGRIRRDDEGANAEFAS